ncbi:DUF418 domain-containing protein [Sphingobium sp. CAP-1]|uniref:DUF418 domain-containing protein n=1 Tax=Sphingobium sp. CAP-1 TaxID=2676077 RepID=UPI0012BB259D|nr:DUF418 domain-containing protein [Sphingobium sp. CAP-1]QGP78396.1 DUF418 domain-containing protein [Sphingobium sp. CAP-1]
MSETGEVRLDPVRGKARIEVLDILRGIAILGIFTMNLPFMAGPTELMLRDFRQIGWAPRDQMAWSIIQIFWEGTQRGLLEFLFGAALMVLAAKAMKPDGPVAVADLYIRRALWLLLFGLIDIFVLLWPGDILHVYALAALFLFPFRHLRPRVLIPLGLVFATFVAVSSSFQYVERVQLVASVGTAHAHQAQGKPLDKADKTALAEWHKKLDRYKIDKDTREKAEAESKARSGGYMGYAAYLWGSWLTLAGKGSVYMGIAEAFCAMLIGIALWKMGIIQGQRSTRFYALLALAAYGFGLGARAIGVVEITSFQPIPKTYWITNEYARIAVSLGHVALVNLLVRFRVPHAILKPFVAAGQVAFSLYFLEQIIGINFLFSPIALGLKGVFGWATLWGWATGIALTLLLAANIWTRYFVSGPMEWAWRSLAYWRRQPFRRLPEVEESR